MLDLNRHLSLEGDALRVAVGEAFSATLLGVSQRELDITLALADRLAAWQQRDAARNIADIWASRFAGTAWNTPERISNAAGSAAGTGLAKDGQGKVQAVWEQSDAAGNVSVWSNRFDDAP